MYQIEIYNEARKIAEIQANSTVRKWCKLKSKQKDIATRRLIVAAVIKKLKGAIPLGISTPEQKLFFAVVKSAIEDAELGSLFHRSTGIRYFELKNHVVHCDIIGLDSDYVTETLRKFFLWVK